jgi:hypothetical protein
MVVSAPSITRSLEGRALRLVPAARPVTDGPETPTRCQRCPPHPGPLPRGGQGKAASLAFNRAQQKHTLRNRVFSPVITSFSSPPSAPPGEPRTTPAQEELRPPVMLARTNRIARENSPCVIKTKPGEAYVGLSGSIPGKEFGAEFRGQRQIHTNRYINIYKNYIDLTRRFSLSRGGVPLDCFPSASVCNCG